MGVMVAVALVALCVGVRLAVSGGMLPYNFAAVASAALLAGYLLRSRTLALAVPIGSMLVSDVLIGFSPLSTTIVVYLVLAAPVLAGLWLARRPRTTSFVIGGLGLSAVGASVLFFLVTNFEVWLAWGMYERSPGGLLSCYIAALPFFKWTLASNLLFTALIGGSVALARRAVALTSPAPLLAR